MTLQVLNCFSYRGRGFEMAASPRLFFDRLKAIHQRWDRLKEKHPQLQPILMP
jgi:hypothetical protein